MKIASTLTILVTLAMALGSTPAMADPGNGKGKGNNHAQHPHDRNRNDHRESNRYVANCPPGLAKKNPPCVPPGQAKKYGNRVGEVLRVGDYIVVRDLDRYDLDRRRGWDYYRDDDQIYRVDSGTKKILAIMNLIDAFSN